MWNLPEWVFSLAFLYLGCHHIAFALWYIVGRILNMCFAHMRPPHPRRGFSRLFFHPYTQFSLRDFSISFRVGFFCLIFSSKNHVVGFLAYFTRLTPSFRSVTSR